MPETEVVQKKHELSLENLPHPEELADKEASLRDSY